MTQGPLSQPEHPLVGQTIAGKYRVVRLLGEGGMGCVYQGEQALGTTMRKVAIKTLHKHLSHDESIKARFKREVGTVAALEHPNTIQVFDFGETPDGTLYIVMEFVQGRSVADILEKEGPMAPDRVANILRQVVGSLDEAHSHGIVHRDLKPDNVVLSERAGQKDWVEVLDFGIAKRSSEHDPNEAKLTQQGMVLGTPPYMSPEQFTGQPIDARSDIYSLGVMAYEMLSGRLPWQANTAWEWASKHMTEAPTPIERQPLGPGVPAPMRNAITRALAKNKDERFGSVSEFYQAFSNSLAPGAPPEAAALGVANTAMFLPADPQTAASGRSGPVKTELGAPMMAGAMPPMQATPNAPVVQAGVPQAPRHTASNAKKGPPALVLGLGALAAILLLGAGAAFALRTTKKPAATTSLDLTPASSASVEQPVTRVDEPAPVIASAAPLDPKAATLLPTPPTPPTNANAGQAGAKPKPGMPASIPTPTPTPPETRAGSVRQASGHARREPPGCAHPRRGGAVSKRRRQSVTVARLLC